jgi:hypothetical protein
MAVGLIFYYFYLYAALLHWRALRIKFRLRRFHDYETAYGKSGAMTL